MSMLVKRPDDMSYEDYKLYRNVYDKAYKRYKKGRIIWLSKLYPTKRVLDELKKNNLDDKEKSLGRLLHKGETFRGKVKELIDTQND